MFKAHKFYTFHDAVKKSGYSFPGNENAFPIVFPEWQREQ
jgi:hypothetical protein